MHRKEMNDRSPMRVFRKSMHRGLGRGQLGAVVAGPGVGKTALLVQIALDDLLRDRRVLHISLEQAVDHVRAYYSEIFHDLSQVSHLAQAEQVGLELERRRLIFSLGGSSAEAPVSQRGGRSSVSRILEVVGFAQTVAHFEPDVIIIDGFDLAGSSIEALTAFSALAREADAEVWISACLDALPDQSGALPAPLHRSVPWLDVVVSLRPEQDVVRLRMLKDHDNQDVAELHLRLDPHTMRVLEEDLPTASDRMADPRRFRLISGGSHGAEAQFGVCAERWGVAETHYSFEGHRALARSRGVITLGEEELGRGDFSLVYVSRRLRREFSEIPLVRRVLQTIWHQITHSSQVFAIGTIQEDGTVRGGTGWGAELARIWNKPLFVYDQAQRTWFRYAGNDWETAPEPIIVSEVFAGIGTQHLTEDGCRAVEELFLRTFGEPQQLTHGPGQCCPKERSGSASKKLPE